MPPTLEELFDQYLSEIEAGREPDLERLYTLAGPRRNDLEQWVEGHLAVRRFRGALDPAADPQRNGVPDGSVDPLKGLQYVDLQEIGSGGQATVYKARDKRLDRIVALKVLKAENMPAPDSWLREARVLAGLDHPHVVRVYDANVHDGTPYLAMEFVDGWPLNEVLAAMSGSYVPADPGLAALGETLQPLDRRLEFAIALADALAACHDHGILHRDLKPRNVLITRDGQPNLDFGLAHHAKPEEPVGEVTTKLFGTPAYLAPEQMQSGQTGENVRTDLYTLGLVLYELFALERPMRMAASGPPHGDLTFQPVPPIARVAPELNALLDACLENDPARRPARAAAVRDDLERILARRPIRERPGSLRRRLQLFATRHKAGLGLTAALLAIAGTVGALDFADYRMDRGELALAIAMADRYAMQADADPVALTAELRALARLEKQILAADQSPWQLLQGTTLQEDLASTLDRLAARVSRHLQEDLGAREGRSWTASPWLAPALAFENFRTSFGEGSRALVETWSRRPGLVVFEQPYATVHPELRYEVVLREWVRSADRKDPSESADVVFSELEPEERLGSTPLASGSSDAAAVHLAVLLEPGVSYRVSLLSEDSRYYFNFDLPVSTGPGPLRLEITPPSSTEEDEVSAFSPVLEVKTGTGPGSLFEPRPIPVEAFRASRHPVTWAEFRNFAEDPRAVLEHPELEGYAWLSTNRSRDDDPALVPWWLADAFCRWRGSRLPTTLEVISMQDQELPWIGYEREVLIGGGRPWQLNGEWVADMNPEWEDIWLAVRHPEDPKASLKKFHQRILVAPLLDPRGNGEFLVRQDNPYVFRCVRSLKPR